MISRTLEAWPESPAQLLEDIERFVRLSTKFASTYELTLTVFLFPVTTCEIEAVLTAEDKLVAAQALLEAKVNRWD